MKRGKALLKEYAYIDEQIENKIDSKINSLQWDVNYYFRNRNKGLAGVSLEHVKQVTLYKVRQLKVWREIKARNDYYAEH